MSYVTKLGPKTITLDGHRLPEWFIGEDGRRFEFYGKATLDADGGFELSRLSPGQCLLFPGAICQVVGATSTTTGALPC